MSTCTHDAISSLLAEIDRRIISASIATRGAQAALAECKRNQCIGTILPLGNDLRIALALYEAILIIHQNPLPETAAHGGGA